MTYNVSSGMLSLYTTTSNLALGTSHLVCVIHDLLYVYGSCNVCVKNKIPLLNKINYK